MCIHPHKQRAADVVFSAVISDGLRDREDVRFGEGRVQGSAAMTAGAEGNELPLVGGVGFVRVIGGEQCRNVDENGSWGWLAGEGAQRHSGSL